MSGELLYAEFFGLSERPFTLLPDPGFLYWSPQHMRAFSVLEFGILSRAPITLITGEIGAGKTTLLQELLRRIEEEVTIGLVSNAQGGRGELLQWVLNALNVPFTRNASYVQMFQRLQEFLIFEYSEGRRVILIFDEAQNLSAEGLEELRMLTNINANKDELIQLILVGQPELRDMVRQPRMRQLAQRVAASFHLTAMDADTVRHYIAHRLKIAGGTGAEFTPEAARLVFRATGGVPRLVNQLCDFAMLYAWSNESRLVTEDTVRTVLSDGVFFGARDLGPDDPAAPGATPGAAPGTGPGTAPSGAPGAAEPAARAPLPAPAPGAAGRATGGRPAEATRA
jgi:type II secretory pathway predicted ATPase ExeA